MFWRMTALSASSPVEAVLDKDNFTLEDLLDEEEIIHECKAVNSRLINFLCDRAQLEQLLRYIVEEAPEDAERKRAFKFPFIACEIFMCEIDAVLNTLVDEEELMDLLFSFLEPNRPHSTLLAGYFSKVVACLMLRKTTPLMNYIQVHQDAFCQLVDLIGITSIMESFPEVHANAAETLCVITQNAPSALATKLSSPSFVARIFGHALEVSELKSALVHSLSVCISLLDPKRASISPLFNPLRSQHLYEPSIHFNPETISAMLPKLGDLLMLLNVSNDERVLLTTYGELRPPLGKHRLKIVEFIAVLLRAGNEVAEKELVSSGTIQRILDLFFEYPFNNLLHHHVESTNNMTVDHLFRDCNLIGKFLQADKRSVLSGDCGQEHDEWIDWQVNVLQERYHVENVHHWACGRPTALQDRIRDSDEDELHDRDYDVAILANNLIPAFGYNMFEHDDGEEVHGSLEQDDEDTYFDDESTEVVISSLRFGDGHESSLFTNSNWFAFRDDKIGGEHLSTSQSEKMDKINLSCTANGGSNHSDDEVVVGEDEDLADSAAPMNGESRSNKNALGECANNGPVNGRDLNPQSEKTSSSADLGFFQVATADSSKPFGDRAFPDWVGWQESLDLEVGRSERNPSSGNGDSDVNLSTPMDATGTNVKSFSDGKVKTRNDSMNADGSSDRPVGADASKMATVSSLFKEYAEFVGMEVEDREKAMVQTLKEGIVGEAGFLKRNHDPKLSEGKSTEDGTSMFEFNDANYYQEVAVLE